MKIIEEADLDIVEGGGELKIRENDMVGKEIIIIRIRRITFLRIHI